MAGVAHIIGSVGYMAMNWRDDVRRVQVLLNQCHSRFHAGTLLEESGRTCTRTIEVIRDFQRRFGEFRTGRVEPGSRFLHSLSGAVRPGSNVLSRTIEVLVSDGRLVSPGSQWGHVAIDVNGIVYSRAHMEYRKMARSVYLAHNSFRDTEGLVLRVSVSELAAIQRELDKKIALQAPYDIQTNSCSTNAADVLEKVGILAHDPRFQWDPAVRTAVSPKEVLIVVSRSWRLAARHVYRKVQ